MWEQITGMFTLDRWVFIGFFGQFIFFLRFLVQWLYSEKHGESLIPVQFWYLSIIGALVVFAYAIERRDPVFFLGQLFAIVIYARNLWLIKRRPHHENEKRRIP